MKPQKTDVINNWIIWSILILVFVLFYPKPCGIIPPSKTLESNCYGINSIFRSSGENNTIMNWCSGVCVNKIIAQSNSTINEELNDPLIGGVSSEFTQLLPKLFLVLVLIALIKMLMDMRKNKKSGDIKVIKADDIK